MNANWDEVNRLFHQALEFKGEQRADFLSRTLQNNPTLGQEVESLLAAHDENYSFMERPVLAADLAPQFNQWREKIADEMPAQSRSGRLGIDRPTGQLLDGKYQIEELCGRGGMGAVYRATHVGTGRRVAVKVIAPELVGNAEFIERFRREAKTIGLLRHPNIVNVTDFEITGSGRDTTAYLVMEYLEGGTLAERLKARRPMPLDETIGILAQVCEAIDEAHRHGILHRDLKPENIWLEAVSGNVKVLDFGIARLHDLLAPSAVKIDAEEIMEASGDRNFEQQPLSITEEETLRFNYTLQQLSRFGSVMGTPKYMSPEQGRGEPLDKRSDVYSLGVIAYQMLAGDPPFVGTTAELLRQHREVDPVPLRERRRRIPSGIEAVVLQALAKDPGNRPASAGAFAFLLLLQSEDKEWIRHEMEEVRENRWKLLTLALRTQWPGWMISSLGLLGMLALPGMKAGISLLIFSTLWLVIAAISIFSHNALTAGCTLFLGNPNGVSGIGEILRTLRHRAGDLFRATAAEFLSLFRFRGLGRIWEKSLLIPSLVQEELTVEAADDHTAALAEPIRNKLRRPFFNRILVYAWILTALQAGLLMSGFVIDEGSRGWPQSLLFLWLPVVGALGLSMLLMSLRSSIEQAMLYLAARRALGEIPINFSTFFSRSEMTSSPIRERARWKANLSSCILLILLLGFHWIKFPFLLDRYGGGNVFSVKALNISGVPVPLAPQPQYTLLNAIHSPSMMKFLIEKGASVNAPIRINAPLTPRGIGEINSTPLMAALSNGSHRTARLFIDHGADVHARDSIGRTPMTVAITHCPRSIEMLLSSGVSLDEQTRYGTPLLTAARYQWLYTTDGRRDDWWYRDQNNPVRILLSKGANPNAPDAEGRTPLMVMSFVSRHDRAVEVIGDVLLNAGADIDAKDKNGQTPLIYAIRFHRHAAIKLLLNRGANLTLKDSNQETALDWARKSKDNRILQLFSGDKGGKV